MRHLHYLFGSDQMGTNEVCDALSIALGISFNTRESDFRGGEYHLARFQESGKISIEKNWADDEGYLAEPDFSQYFTLVYITSPTPHMLSALENASYLQHLRVEYLD